MTWTISYAGKVLKRKLPPHFFCLDTRRYAALRCFKACPPWTAHLLSCGSGCVPFLALRAAPLRAARMEKQVRLVRHSFSGGGSVTPFFVNFSEIWAQNQVSGFFLPFLPILSKSCLLGQKMPHRRFMTIDLQTVAAWGISPHWPIYVRNMSADKKVFAIHRLCAFKTGCRNHFRQISFQSFSLKIN